VNVEIFVVYLVDDNWRKQIWWRLGGCDRL